MAKTRLPYSPEFRRQMVELVHAGRTPEELAAEFEPTAQSIRNWLAQSERNAGRGDGGLTTAEREELNRLRRENRQLRLEREILSKAAAWFARETNTIPSVDAPFQARENVGVVVARGRMLSSVRPLMRQEDSRRPVCAFAGRVQITRSVLEAHPKRARSTVESPGCPSPVSPTVAPYSPSARPYVLAIVGSLPRRGRSSVGAAFDQQGPDDAGHLVGQSDGDQHFRLARQHLRKPRPLGCPRRLAC